MTSNTISTPNSPWVLSMKWHDVLFLHWPVDVEKLTPYVPDDLTVETYDGTGWLGVVPFTMSGIRPRFVPPLPFVSNFPEINIRTYVSDGEKTGVWFFSLDASSWLAVKAARLTYSLDYYHAEMNVERSAGRVTYSSKRSAREPGMFDFDGHYEPTGQLNEDKGEFEKFLTERYYLYSADERGSIYRGAIEHDPWELYHADYELNHLEIRNHPSPASEPPTSVLYSPYQEVRAWLPRSVN